MPKVAKRIRPKPPIRRVPPGENRGPRRMSISTSATKEEVEQIKTIANAFGFKNASQLLRHFLNLMFALEGGKSDPAAALDRFVQETFERVAKVAGAQQLMPLDTILDVKDLERRADAAIKKSFGEQPKEREGGPEPSASRLEAGHVT